MWTEIQKRKDAVLLESSVNSGNPIRRNKCDLKYIARVENTFSETVEFRIKSTKNTPPAPLAIRTKIRA